MAQAMASDFVSMPVATPRAASVVENRLGRDVADHFIACERATAESGKRAVEAAASRFVCRENFFGGVFRAAVQMHADFDARDAIFHGAV